MIERIGAGHEDVVVHREIEGRVEVSHPGRGSFVKTERVEVGERIDAGRRHIGIVLR